MRGGETNEWTWGHARAARGARGPEERRGGWVARVEMEGVGKSGVTASPRSQSRRHAALLKMGLEKTELQRRIDALRARAAAAEAQSVSPGKPKETRPVSTVVAPPSLPALSVPLTAKCVLCRQADEKVCGVKGGRMRQTFRERGRRERGRERE